MTRPKRALLTAFLTLVAAYLAICAAAFFWQRKIIYHPNRAVYATPAEAGLPFEASKLVSSDSIRFTVWRIPNAESQSVVVCFHGNADNISANIDLYLTWYNLGATIIACEYRGYLDSEGEPSEEAIERDLGVLADTMRLWYAGKDVKVVAMGRSLGGAVAAKFAKKYRVDGLILESTFSAMHDVAHLQFPFLPAKLLLREKYDSESILRDLEIPVLVIHSPSDETIPYHLGRKLYNAANEPKEFIEIQGGHNAGVNVSRDQIETAYRNFLKNIRLQK